MRQIKFRAWNIVFQKMFYPSQKNRKTSGLYEGGGHTEYLTNILYDLDYRPMQFTGLYDKNGKEIYEGDVLKNLAGITYPVKYEYSSFTYRGYPISFDQYGGMLDTPDTWGEVVGNIYENPDLV